MHTHIAARYNNNIAEYSIQKFFINNFRYSSIKWWIAYNMSLMISYGILEVSLYFYKRKELDHINQIVSNHSYIDVCLNNSLRLNSDYEFNLLLSVEPFFDVQEFINLHNELTENFNYETNLLNNLDGENRLKLLLKDVYDEIFLSDKMFCSVLSNSFNDEGLVHIPEQYDLPSLYFNTFNDLKTLCLEETRFNYGFKLGLIDMLEIILSTESMLVSSILEKSNNSSSRLLEEFKVINEIEDMYEYNYNITRSTSSYYTYLLGASQYSDYKNSSNDLTSIDKNISEDNLTMDYNNTFSKEILINSTYLSIETSYSQEKRNLLSNLITNSRNSIKLVSGLAKNLDINSRLQHLGSKNYILSRFINKEIIYVTLLFLKNAQIENIISTIRYYSENIILISVCLILGMVILIGSYIQIYIYHLSNKSNEARFYIVLIPEYILQREDKKVKAIVEGLN